MRKKKEKEKVRLSGVNLSIKRGECGKGLMKLWESSVLPIPPFLTGYCYLPLTPCPPTTNPECHNIPTIK